MTVEEYFGDWQYVVDLKEADRILKRLISSGKRTCPKVKDIFRAFRLCSFKDLRLVILGQDPYPQKGVATGIAFGNRPNTLEDRLSPSLITLRDSVIDYTKPHNVITFDVSLEKWEEQGVLLLNSALSCEEGKIGSHYLLWKPFISSFLTNLSKSSTGIVYVLMGNQAQRYEPYINKRYNHILKCGHPSYYARLHQSMPGEIWKEINRILIGLNGHGIKWYEEYKF